MGGEWQLGTLLIMVGIGISIMAFKERMFPLGIFWVLALPIGLIITWDEWKNKQRWMNSLFRKVAKLFGKEDLE